MKKYLIPILMLVGLSFAGDLSHFPAFALDDIGGNRIYLDSLLGEKPVVITYWATWCKPCIAELKKLSPLWEEMDSSFELIAICEDGPRSRAKAKSYWKKEKYGFPTVFDKNGENKKAAGVGDIPELFILDLDGTIIYHHAGYKPGDEITVKKHLQEWFDEHDDNDAENPYSDENKPDNENLSNDK